MSRKYLYSLILTLCVCVFLAACSEKSDDQAQSNNNQNTPAPSQQQNTQQPSSQQPAAPAPGYKGGKVELTLFDHNTGLSDEEFELYYGTLLRAKFPDITITKLSADAKINELVASNSTPDIVTFSNAVINQYLAIDYPQDLTEMVRQYNIDLAIFEPEAMKAMNDYSSKGELIGLPFGDNSSALVYNQDIFDKFALEFPKQVITLEEYMELVRRLTIKDGDIQYVGGNVHEVNVMNSAGLAYIDSNNKDKAMWNTDNHKYVWSLLQQIYKIPNYVDETGRYRHSASLFWRDQRMAMNWTWVDNTIKDVSNNQPTFNWNIHSQPVIWKDKPSRNSLDFHMLAVSKTSKNKDAAYAVISHIVSKDLQTVQNRSGRLSSYADPQMKKEYAQDSGVFNGKDIANVFLVGPTPLWPFTEHLAEVDKGLRETARQLANENADLNTAIRIGEELTDGLIKEKLATK